MKLNKNKNKNKNKLYGGNTETILIVFLLISISIIFGLIIYNIYKNKNKIKSVEINQDFEIDNIINPLSEFLKNLAQNNKLIDGDILKNISNKLKLSNITNDKFVIDNFLYIRTPLHNFQ